MCFFVCQIIKLTYLFKFYHRFFHSFSKYDDDFVIEVCLDDVRFNEKYCAALLNLRMHSQLDSTGRICQYMLLLGYLLGVVTNSAYRTQFKFGRTVSNCICFTLLLAGLGIFPKFSNRFSSTSRSYN